MNNTQLQAISLLLAMFTPVVSSAYVGPGAGMSAIGSALAFIALILLLIIGFLWYPIKKFLNRNKAEATAADKSSDGQSDNHSDGASDDKAQGF